MNPPNTESLLRVWDESHNSHPINRALNLLDAAAPGIGRRAWFEAPVGRRDECLLELYEMLFGRQLQTVSRCPRCDETLESSFTTRDIGAHAVVPLGKAMQKLRTHGCCIEYRLPNSDDLLQVSFFIRY